jgi:hypothetical protein
MIEAGVASAQHAASFLLESLVWNVPDDYFGAPSVREDLITVVSYLFVETKPEKVSRTWLEVNGIKYLFSSAQPWTLAQANAFLLDALVYAELT